MNNNLFEKLSTSPETKDVNYMHLFAPTEIEKDLMIEVSIVTLFRDYCKCVFNIFSFVRKSEIYHCLKWSLKIKYWFGGYEQEITILKMLSKC